MKERVRIMKICLLGRTETNKVVIFSGEDKIINTIIDIRITEDCLWYLKGEIIEKE